jgi:hypothetical protein
MAVKNPLAVLSAVVLLSLGSASAIALSDQYTEYKSTWDSENECISELVSLGIERSKITRVNGKCTFSAK